MTYEPCDVPFEPCDRHMPVAIENHSAYVGAIRQGLLDLCFTREEAALWANTWTCQSPPEAAVAQAVEFDDLGISITTAATWHAAGFYAKEAVAWIRGGFTIDQADLITAKTGMFEAYEWLDLHLPPTLVVAFVRAKVSPDEAETWMVLDPEDRHQRLVMLAALNGSAA